MRKSISETQKSYWLKMLKQSLNYHHQTTNLCCPQISLWEVRLKDKNYSPHTN